MVVHPIHSKERIWFFTVEFSNMVWPIQAASEIRVFSLVKEKRNCTHHNRQYLFFLLFLLLSLNKELLKEIRIGIRIDSNHHCKTSNGYKWQKQTEAVAISVQPLLVVWRKTFASKRNHRNQIVKTKCSKKQQIELEGDTIVSHTYTTSKQLLVVTTRRQMQIFALSRTKMGCLSRIAKLLIFFWWRFLFFISRTPTL